MEDVTTSIVSQRFQVKISGLWNDYGPKEDDILKVAFDNFIRKKNEKTLNPQESFKELVIKGRRYVVDFNKMIQVRKDNKKDYKVRPPAGSAVSDGSQNGPREQGHLQLTCEQCNQPYTLRRFGYRSEEDDEDWSDCSYCHDCWRPHLDKQKLVEDKKVDKNRKQRQVAQPCREYLKLGETISYPLEQLHADEQQSTEATLCTYCGQPFRDDQAVFLGGCDMHCVLCHEECGKKQVPDALAVAKQYYNEYLNSHEFRCKDLNPGSDLKRTIHEEYQKKDHSRRPREVTAF